MAVRNNRRILITKRILKESLLDLLQEKSISHITIKEICELSQMSRSTFYLHYTDQFALLQDMIDETLNNSTRVLADQSGPIGTLESIENFLYYIKEQKYTFSILLNGEENMDFQNRLIEGIRRLIADSDDIFRNTENAEYILNFMLYGSLSMIRLWIKEGFDVPVSNMAALILQTCSSAYPQASSKK